MQRRVEPEILDHLAAEDPAAVRSRRDLRRINFLMGNERWILRQVRRAQAEVLREGIAEIGAGEGTLTVALQSLAPGPAVQAYDLVPRPAALPAAVGWHQGDVRQAAAPQGGIVVANLLLHHFEGEALRELGARCGGARLLLFSEPLRSRLALGQGGLLLPFVDPVTRHDMMVSIRAGFRPGELAPALGLDPAQWAIREECTWRGGLRVLACRL